MRKALPLVALGVVGVLTVLAFFLTYAVAGTLQSQDLIAGQTEDVGSVDIWDSGGNLYVKFTIDEEGWYMTSTHVHVADDVMELPHSSAKNPSLVPGQFDYSESYDINDMITTKTWTISLTGYGNPLYIAAHAVVSHLVESDGEECIPISLDEFALLLPDTATISITFGSEGGAAYFTPIAVTNGNDFINGNYPGWCVDADHKIVASTAYSANVYSSYETLPTGLIDVEAGLDNVNWLLNQNFVGTAAVDNNYPDADGNGLGESLGTYTYGDVEVAIWTLIEDVVGTSGLNSWDQDRVNELVAMANAHDGYVPGCHEKVGVIFAPWAYDAAGAKVTIQVVLVMIDLPCEPQWEDETAWGYGLRWNSKGSWATYITYTV